MRAMALPILLFMLELIGLGLSPMITGFMSDLLTPKLHEEALRYAVSMTVMVNRWCASNYFM